MHQLTLDIINLKRKVDAGADVIITQLFYDNRFFFDFMDKIQKVGINIPVIPGLSIGNLAQIEKMATLCGASIPGKLFEKLKRYENDSEASKEIGIGHYTLMQCRELLENKVPGLDFCTLNKAFASGLILKELISSEQHIIY